MSNLAVQKPLNSKMAISKSGIEHISKDEGFSAIPYNDIAGNCTVGVGNAKDVLAFANKGDYQKVEIEMNRFVYITEKGKDGKPSRKKFSNGLANRRKRETVPFQIQP